MARPKSDKLNFTRRGETRLRVAGVRVALPLLVFVCLGLLLLSRLNHTALADARWRLAEWLSPVLDAAMVPLEPVRRIGRAISEQADLADEVQRLRSDNQKLSSWEWRARDLERRLADLKALARVVEEPRIDFVTGRVIADSSGAFVRSVMIDAGSDKLVKSGYPVINANGLVGRVLETGASSSRVLLATDLNSRIPVVIGEQRVRAILAGDNGPRPLLLYVPPDARIAVGDDVATSGAGGVFPRGLRIGKVTGDPAKPSVSLRAKLDTLEYVSVLFFDDPVSAMMSQPHGGARETAAAARAGYRGEFAEPERRP